MSSFEQPTEPGGCEQSFVGQVVGGHEVLSLIAAGGMGEVYLVRHRALGLHRAIKVLHDDHREDRVARERFRREADALAHLQHHNIVQIVDYGQVANGWPYLCLEFIDGLSLETLLSTHGPASVADALQILRQLASGLAYAHSRAVVHRDLKPSNVLLRHGDPRQAKIIDFGLVRLLSDETLTKLTRAEQIVGSPIYMSPEQAEGRDDITGAADIYGLAGIAYSLISGKPPFATRSILSLIHSHCKETPQRLSTRVPEAPIPALLDELLAACLRKDPGARPSADEVESALASILSGIEPDTTPSWEPAWEESQSAVGKTAQLIDGGTPLGALVAQVSHEVGADSLAGAFANQLLAVVDELARRTARASGEIAVALAEADRLRSDMGEVELELALLEAQRDEAPIDGRATLSEAHATLAAQAALFAESLRASQRRLIELIQPMRRCDFPELVDLFADLDELESRLRERC